MKKSMSKKLFVLLLMVIIISQAALTVYFGAQKSGYHMDEMFSLLLSNHDCSVWMSAPYEDNNWTFSDAFFHALTTPDTEDRFQYAQVYASNANDVHPPMYYFLLHTVFSILPNALQGIGIKWAGIGINLLFAIGNTLLVAALTYKLSQRKAYPALIAAAFYALNPATMSQTLLIRMYMMLTFFILLVTLLHVHMLGDRPLRFGLFLFYTALACFMGFMTQYYFIIFMAFLSAFYFVVLLVQKRGKHAAAYAAALIATLGATYLFYPAWFAHIFLDYRGTEIQSNFATENLFTRLHYCFNNLNSTLLNNSALPLTLIFIALIIGAVVLRFRVKKQSPAQHPIQPVPLPLYMLSFATLGYFIILSKITLLAGESTSRYFYPIYPFILILIILALDALLTAFPIAMWLRCTVLCVSILCIDAGGYTKGQPFYRYTEQAQLSEFAQAEHSTPVIVAHYDTGYFNSLLNQFMQYEKLYFYPALHPAKITDERLLSYDRVLLYSEIPHPDFGCDTQQVIDTILEECPLLDQAEFLANCNGLFELYLLT